MRPNAKTCWLTFYVLTIAMGCGEEAEPKPTAYAGTALDPAGDDLRPPSRPDLGASLTPVEPAGDNVEPTDQAPPSVPTASCDPITAGPALAPHLTEADPTYRERLGALDLEVLPERYELGGLIDLDRTLIAYMLGVPDVAGLTRDDLAARGLMGRSVLLALGANPAPDQADLSELRRGLYHFYNCDRAHPASLMGFKARYGDYTAWSMTLLEESRPKIHPRRLWQNPDLGIYVAETLRDGEVHETEIIMTNHRSDGALEFLAYLSNGEIANRGEFKTGSTPAIGASPYVCLSCHHDPRTNTYHLIPD